MKSFPFLILLILPILALSGHCPDNCSCPSPGTIFCTRHFLSMPHGLPTSTTHLYIFRNNIEVVTQEDFSGLSRLELLDMSQNNLTGLPDRVFESLTSLRNLDLSSNHIVHISRDAFSGLARLERLYLFSNRIQSIHPGAFQGLEDLLELKLEGNLLTSLPALHLPKLLLLDLSHNSVPQPGSTELRAPRLEYLKLAGLGLSGLDENLLVSLVNLRELDISNNQLRVVPPGLRGARGLIRLSLAANPLHQLKQEDLYGLENLQELDVSNLNLQGFPQGFHQLLPRLKHLAAAGNPFNCLCPLAWLPGWLREQKVKLGRPEETRCHFPPQNSGKVLGALGYKDFGCPAATVVSSTVAIAHGNSTHVPLPQTTLPRMSQATLPPPLIDGPSTETLSPPPPPASTFSPSDTGAVGPEVCISSICLNGGTCHLDQQGRPRCRCPQGVLGPHCEDQAELPPVPALPTAPVITGPNIFTRRITSTTIQLDLHRYIASRPDIQGIRLTYRNLSGPDRRPMQLSVPPSYPEFTLRGLRPNATYRVCASPLGEPGIEFDGSCTEAATSGQELEPVSAEARGLPTTMLAPALVAAFVVLAAVVVAAAICFLRRRRAKSLADPDPDDPSLMELEGAKSSLSNGALLEKQPEMAPSLTQNGGECEILFSQGHCPANNNIASKSSYF